MLLCALLVLSLGSSPSFPLPAVDGKPVVPAEDQRVFRVPLRFERLRAFYADHFKGVAGVIQRTTGLPGARVLTITNAHKGERWTRAVVTEKDIETVVAVTEVLRLSDEHIEGKPPRPLVEFVFSRSPEVDRAVNERITHDHLEEIRQ